MSESFQADWMNAANRKKLEEIPASQQPKAQLKETGKMDACNGVKNVYAAWFIDQTIMNPGSLLRERRLRTWKKSSRFQSFAKSYAASELEKFRMSGLFSVICATLVVYFLNAVVTGHFVMNFSVDAVIGVAAAVLLVVNQRLFIKTANAWQTGKNCLMMNIAAVLLALLCKLWMPEGFDISLFIFVLAYFLEKRMFDRQQKQQLDQYCS